LRLNGNSVTLGGLSATAGTAFVENNSATPVTLTVSDATTESFAGIIRDGTGSAPLSLAKAGSGTLTLTATNTYGGTTRVNQGTLSLGLGNALATSSNLILGGGKVDTGGFGQALGTLQLAANSGIDMNAGASVLQLANSSGVVWTPGATLSILNWSGTLGSGGGTDQVIVGTTGSGLTSAQLSQIHFQGFNGASIRANGEVVPQAVSTRLLGDFNGDSHVNNGDIPVLMNALIDLNAYKSANSLTSDDVLNIGDLDLSGNITNADLQGLLDYLKGGHGSTNPVPEPASWLLMGLGIACLAGIKHRKFV
jgi:autotransporter-associated beta strand protein